MKTTESNFMYMVRTNSSKILPESMVKGLLFFYKKIKKIKMPEQKKSFGELYPDRTFYVIRLYPPATGYLANYIYVLGYMKYAYSKGYIPVVDMVHYQNMYNNFSESDGKGDDIWGWFFEQPWDYINKRRYTLDEVYQAKNVILSCGSEDFHVASYDEATICWQRDMIGRIPFKQSMLEYLQKKSKILSVSNDNETKILGCQIRGTDLERHVAGHYRQLSGNDAYHYIQKYLEVWYKDKQCRVFVNCEEEETLRFLDEKLENLVYTDNKRVSNYKKGNAAFANGNVEKETQLREYLADIYLLSRCDSMIGTHNNGVYTAFLWSDGNFTNYKLIDLGKWV